MERMTMLDLTHVRLEDVLGVGMMELDLEPGKQAYVFIGANGVGKTKLLEAIFQVLLFTFDFTIPFKRYDTVLSACLFNQEKIDFKELFDEVILADAFGKPLLKGTKDIKVEHPHQKPFVFISAHQRGFIPDNKKPIEEELNKLGTAAERRQRHLDGLLSNFINKADISSNLPNVEQWFVKIAQNTNPFMRSEDKREVEIRTVLNLLNQVDHQIDPMFIEYDGDENVHIKVSGKDRQLSQLSTGFVSLVKIIQAIVSGYGYFTNTQDLQHIEGIVLIDEIESHLHLEWQVKIISTLKKLFPNTTFFIATHSPLVLSQLEDGDAYELRRDADDVVRTHKIPNPGNTAMIDLLKQAFNVDLNRLALERPISEAQKLARKALLARMNSKKVAQ